MESNMIAPLKWEWKNQVTLSTSTTDVSQKLGSPEWEVEEDSGIDSGYLCSSVVAGPGPGQVSLCKSSNSASTNSSSVGEVKSAKFKLKGSEGLGDGLISKIEKRNRTVSSPTLETSVGSAEPVLSLKLSKQTYLKEVWSETNAMVASHPVIPTERFKMKCQTNHAPHCQVEGCNLDLSSSKDYHRKHRVCETHSRSPKVLVAGVERRFCQQCSRFHGLVEFDEKKRSCRKRLAEHNARRRKPQTEAVHCSSMRSSESHGADGKRELSFVWNQMPFAHMKRNETLSWEGLVSSKAMQIRSYSSTKVEKIEGQLLMPGNQQSGSMSMHGHRSHGFSISKADSNTSEFFSQGMDESSVPSNIGAAQDIQRALSLLSADAWSSCEVKHGSMTYSTPALYPGMSEPLMQMGSHGFPLAESSAWQSREPLSATLDSPISTIPFKDSSC